MKEQTPLHKNPARREFLWKERSEKKFDINPRDRVIAREQSASRGQAEKVVGAAGRSVRTSGTMEDAQDTEHNGQAVWPPGGPREHRTVLSGRDLWGHGLGARGPVRNIARPDRR